MKKILRHLRLLALIASFALFVYVLKRSGPAAVLNNIRLLGWGFVILIVLSGVRQVLRSVAWSYCFQTDGPRPAPLELFGPRLVGEALDDLTPAGPLLGQTAKLLVVPKRMPAEVAVPWRNALRSSRRQRCWRNSSAAAAMSPTPQKRSDWNAATSIRSVSNWGSI